MFCEYKSIELEDNIERAIKKASDKDTANYKEVLFEGYAPHGIAIVVETATNNNNRTVANVRAAVNKCDNESQTGATGGGKSTRQYVRTGPFASHEQTVPDPAKPAINPKASCPCQE